MATKGKVAIIGSGLIGRCWAVIFSKAGFSVCLYDVDSNQLSAALEAVKHQLLDFESKGLLNGPIKDAESASRLVSGQNELKEALKDAMYLQECVPENVELKKRVFEEIDRHAASNTILASSSSCICPSLFTADLLRKSQCLVAHPVNPPYFIPLVEVVPSAWTCPEVVERTVALMKEIGQSPVVVRKEVNGFLLNRLQYAILMEAWRLVEDGVCSPEDIDTVMTAGLGPRYSLIGPFETMHLNAAGVIDYCTRYGPNIETVCKDQLNVRSFSGQTMETIHSAMCTKTAVEDLAERRKWRDRRLAALALHKMNEHAKDLSENPGQ